MSMLLALVPLPYRILALAVLAAALYGTGWLKGNAHGTEKLADYQAEEASESLKLLNDTILKSRQLQAKKDEALNAAAQREQKYRDDARAAGDAAAGMRVDLRESRELLSRASVGSLRARVAALEDVLEQCVERYRSVAEKADGHASDALTFEQAWPK